MSEILQIPSGMTVTVILQNLCNYGQNFSTRLQSLLVNALLLSDHVSKFIDIDMETYFYKLYKDAHLMGSWVNVRHPCLYRYVR